jgi:hypothetical protein
MDDETHPDRLLSEPAEQREMSQGPGGRDEVNGDAMGVIPDPNAKAVEEVVNSEVCLPALRVGVRWGLNWTDEC